MSNNITFKLSECRKLIQQKVPQKSFVLNRTAINYWKDIWNINNNEVREPGDSV